MPNGHWNRAALKNDLLQAATRELEQNKIVLDKRVSRLSTLNEDLVRFSKAISHDLQEPIRKVALFADIIYREEKQKLSESSLSSIDKIKSGSKRMRDLISCLQQYVGVDTAHAAITNCDLSVIIATAQQKAIIDTRFPEIIAHISKMPIIDGYSDQLELLFYHLITNSIRFRRGSQTDITIDCDIIQQNSFKATHDKYRYIDVARIRFADKGIGFDDRYAAYIFQLFKKAHNTDEGLGFGLAICKKIAENHYGEITAQGVAGNGSTFTILLPLIQEAEV